MLKITIQIIKIKCIWPEHTFPLLLDKCCSPTWDANVCIYWWPFCNRPQQNILLSHPVHHEHTCHVPPYDVRDLGADIRSCKLPAFLSSKSAMPETTQPQQLIKMHSCCCKCCWLCRVVIRHQHPTTCIALPNQWHVYTWPPPQKWLKTPFSLPS